MPIAPTKRIVIKQEIRAIGIKELLIAFRDINPLDTNQGGRNRRESITTIETVIAIPHVLNEITPYSSIYNAPTANTAMGNRRKPNTGDISNHICFGTNRSNIIPIGRSAFTKSSKNKSGNALLVSSSIFITS